MNLTEAFQKLDLLESEDFDITSSTDKADLRNFIDEDDIDSEIDIIDLQKDEEDELDDSYVGKIVTECVICHSKFYKDPEEIKLDVESGNCNVDEECPICFSQDGYKVIGKIEPVSDEEIEDSQSDDVDVDNEVDIDETDDDIEETNESYRRRGRAIRESRKHLCKNCDDDLDETLAGTLKGAAVGLLSGHPIKGALAGSAASNIKAGKDNWFERAKLGAATNGFKGVTDAIKNGLNLNNAQPQNESYLQEGIESAEIVTDDDIISIGTGEDGSFNISSSPKDDGMGMEGETIVPIEPEDAQQIVDAQNPDEEEMPEDGQEPAPEQEVDVDVQDFDEESFDNLGESYLRRVYENVNKYKTTRVSKNGNNLIIEGLIKFNSGKVKRTSFIFESYKITKSGKVKFIGENAQITRGRKAFTLTGNLKRNKFITESLNYNYRQKDSNGKSTRLYGTVRR